MPLRISAALREVVEQLDAYTSAENIPALQGGREHAAIRHRPWSPTKQLVTCLAATAGLGLIATAAGAPARRAGRDDLGEQPLPPIDSEGW